MSPSPEHEFLSGAVVSYLERAATTRLYKFLENQRKTFDFGCVLLRDWTRPIIGQTLWKHDEGIDKDLRTLLADTEAEICLYIARDTLSAHRLCNDVVRDFRLGFRDARVYRLRTIWVPSDFDADSEEHRLTVTKLLEDRLAADVLLNVVLGNLNKESVRHFISSTGRVGLDLAVLYRIATAGFTNLTSLARDLAVASTSLRERLVRLVGCGFLSQPGPDASYYYASLRGRVFLELCREVVGSSPLDEELTRILYLLGLIDEYQRGNGPGGLDALHLRVLATINEFDVNLSNLAYHHFWESEAWPPMLPRPTGFSESGR